MRYHNRLLLHGGTFTSHVFLGMTKMCIKISALPLLQHYAVVPEGLLLVPKNLGGHATTALDPLGCPRASAKNVILSVN